MKASRGNFTTARASRARGFTLLEIVIVLVLGMLLMGGAMGYMVISSSERHLRNASGEIEILAKRARTVAMLQQTPYALLIAQDGVHMMPWAEAVQPDRQQQSSGKKTVGKKDDKTPVADNPRFTPIHADWTPEDGDQLFVRRWASDNWIPVDDRGTQVWRFDTDGICEPLSIRLQTGKNFIETEYHPLTAAIRYTNLEAGK